MDELRERLDSLEAKQTQVKEDGRLSPTGREEALKELEGQINATWQEIESTYNERTANFDKQIGAVMKGTPVPDIPLETMMTENREADRLIGRLTLAGSPKTFLGVIEEAARGTVQSRNAILTAFGRVAEMAQKRWPSEKEDEGELLDKSSLLSQLGEIHKRLEDELKPPIVREYEAKVETLKEQQQELRDQYNSIQIRKVFR
jgi:hypothetical protein